MSACPAAAGLPGGQRVLVIGAGLAGLRVAEGLQTGGFMGTVTLIGDEPHPPYNRPPLSKSALSEGVNARQLAFKRRVDANTDHRFGTRVVSVDLSTRLAALATGEVLDFDILVTTSGVTPRRTVTKNSTTGAPLNRALAFKTIDDLVALRSLLRPQGNVVIVGSGFVGCELASSLSALGQRVTLLARREAPMAKSIGQQLAGRIRAKIDERGIDYRVGTGISTVTEQGGIARVMLGCGTEIMADVVVDAIGSAPALGYLDGNGLDLSDGLLTDTSMRVAGTDNMFAAGDVARLALPHVPGPPRRFEHWTAAVDTAKLVVSSILQRDTRPPRPFMPAAWSDQFGHRIQAFGVRLSDAIEVDLTANSFTEHEFPGAFITGFVSDGVLTGVCALSPSGRPSPAMAWRPRLFSDCDFLDPVA